MFALGEIADGAALALYRDKRFDLEFPNPANGTRYVLRSKGWIGHIPVGPDTLVRVRPKLPVARVFELLEVAYNLKSFELFKGETAVDTIDGLFERVASILARRVLDRARRGLHQQYVGERDDLPFLRGRIDVQQSVRRGPVAAIRMPCEFEELTADLDDNRLLLWALHRTARGGL